MGDDIQHESFSEGDYLLFSQRLQNSLGVLQDLLSESKFGQGPLSLGAEMEAYIANVDGEVLPVNLQLLEQLKHPQLQLELNRFNIEYNLKPVPLASKPFSQLEAELNSALSMLQSAAQHHDGVIVPIGILPTLKRSDLNENAITDLPRYRVLSDSLNRIRGEDFVVDIRGEDKLTLTSANVAYEGANTSYQIHLRVEPERFADTFNTIQLVTPLLVALSANSPLLLQQLLWEETRIALFKQSVDYRIRKLGCWQEPARVAFGHGWVRESAWELFAETVALHRPIMPVIAKKEPEDFIRQGEIPELSELRLHMGSVWPWNRAVYDFHDGGHLRIEMRALPSGPTAADMVANTALYVGLALGLRDYVRDWLPSIPFHYAEYNFYRAAQRGLAAVLVWPHRKKQRVTETPLKRILETLIPYAKKGLIAANVNVDEVDYFLNIIERRFEKSITAAAWQRAALKHFERCGASREEACRLMYQRYCAEQKSGQVLADWNWEQ